MSKKWQLKAELSALRGQLQALFENSPDLMFFIDTEGHVTEFDTAAGPILRYTKDQLQEMQYVDLFVEGERAGVQERFAQVMQGRAEQFETRLTDVDGVPHIFEVMAIPTREGGQIVGAFGVARDISQRKAVEHQLQESEQRYRALFEGNIDAVQTYDLEGKFVALNRATEELMGYSAEELIGQPFLQFIVPEERERTIEQFMRVKQGEPVQYETAMYHRDGAVVDLHITVIPIMTDGELQGIHCVGKDITQRKQLETAMHQMAYHDHLTGLPNQRSMHRHLSELLTAHVPFAVMLIDLDRFKSVNDSWGHEVGDLLLKSVTMRLGARLPDNARLFRYGGDEMVAVLQSADPAEVRSFAELLLERFEDSFVLKEREVDMTASIGIATYPEDGDEIDTLFKKADNAMYFSKQRGRNTFVLYRSIAGAGDDQRLELEIELRSALRAGELSMVYQPQVDLRTGVLHGIEALMRWENPRLGSVAPDDFIPVAEESGLIGDLGRWVFETVCAQLADWYERGLGRVRAAANVSIHQFYHEDFVATLQRTLDRFGVEPGQLVLEITESVASNADAVVGQLLRLKQLGVQVALDDFGTGYSSLKYLKDYPIDYLKIDRSFVEGMEAQQGNRVLVTTIIGLAKSFGLDTIAEGVETAAHVEYLRGQGAVYGQGFYFSEALGARELEGWIAARDA